MKKQPNKRWGEKLVGFLVCMTLAAPAHAGQQSVSHQVTIAVPNANEILADRSSFNLNFTDFLPGSETNSELVTYTIKANALNRGEGVIQAKMQTEQPGMTLQANVGSYSKTAGNASLVASQAGYRAIGASWVYLADRQIESGLGNVTVGTLPVTYKAVADTYLDAQNATIEVSVVLVDV